MSKLLRRLCFLALFLCLLTGFLFLTHATWLRWIGEYLTYSQPPCKADIAVVLAGDWFGTRIIKAGELMREGWVPKVLVSGAGVAYGVNEGELAIHFATQAGYPAEWFVNLPSPGRSTLEEARDIVSELRRRKVHEFILVTSNFHTRRAAEIYRKVAPDLPFCVVASTDPDFTPDGWWHTREGRKTAFFEWCKTLAHIFGI